MVAIPWKLSEKPHSLTAQLGFLAATIVTLLWFSSVDVAVLDWDLDGKALRSAVRKKTSKEERREKRLMKIGLLRRRSRLQ